MAETSVPAARKGFMLLNPGQRVGEEKTGGTDLMAWYKLRGPLENAIRGFHPDILPPALWHDPNRYTATLANLKGDIAFRQGAQHAISKYKDRPAPSSAPIRTLTPEEVERVASALFAGPMFANQEFKGPYLEAPGEAAWVAKRTKKSEKKEKRKAAEDEPQPSKRTRFQEDSMYTGGGGGAATAFTAGPAQTAMSGGAGLRRRGRRGGGEAEASGM